MGVLVQELSKIIPMFIKANKEQQITIEHLLTRVQQLENKK